MGKKIGTDGEKLLAMALAAFGIDEKHVFDDSFNPETGVVTILTNGGTRVTFKEGEKPERLDEISITGIPKARKVIAGKGAK